MDTGVPLERLVTGCQAAALPHSYDPTTAVLRRVALAPPPEAPRFLYVGRLSSEKGLEVLLRAFARVLVSAQAACLVLAGGGPQRIELELLTEALGLAASTKFVGPRDAVELGDEYLRATCLVLPSIREPWGLVVNEALAYGCPVVVSNRCGCVPELVSEGVTGFAFRAGSETDLEKNLLRAIDAFADAEQSARNCLQLIAGYSPSAAAKSIMSGCERNLAWSGHDA